MDPPPLPFLWFPEVHPQSIARECRVFSICVIGPLRIALDLGVLSFNAAPMHSACNAQ